MFPLLAVVSVCVTFPDAMNVTVNYPAYNVSHEDCSLPVAHGITLISVNSILGVLGTFGNLMVCVAVATNLRIRRPSNFLLVSLAIADLIVTMVCEPLVVAILAKITFVKDCAPNLEVVYKITSRVSCSASVVHLAAISVDRLLAVTYPLRHEIMMQKYGLKIMLIACWTFSLAVPVMSAVIPDSFPKALLGAGTFAASYIIIIVSYALIMIFLIRLKNRRRQNKGQALSVHVSSRVEVRVACTLAIVIAVFTICWFPLVITLFVAGKALVQPQGVAHMWIRTLALSNSAMNFLIYSLRIRDFHEAYGVICRRICSFFLCKTQVSLNLSQ